MQPDHFRNLVAHGNDRVQRCHGILEDHGQALTADLLHLLIRADSQLLVSQEDLSAFNSPRRGLDQFKDRQGRGGLSGSGFAHQSQGLSAADGQGDSVYRLYQTVVGSIFCIEILDCQKIFHACILPIFSGGDPIHPADRLRTDSGQKS